jgi:hypothetical protein
MITSYEVGAIFRIIDEASPGLRKILAQVRELRVALDKTKTAMSEFAAFKPPAGIGTAIGQTNELAASWTRVTENVRGARAAMAQAATAVRGAAAFPPAAGGGGGNRGLFRPGARGAPMAVAAGISAALASLCPVAAMCGSAVVRWRRPACSDTASMKRPRWKTPSGS